eukprot:6177926-Pleurochrysis_carterae.AAC.4
MSCCCSHLHADHHCKRIEAFDDSDTFTVSYLSVFNGRGKITNSVSFRFLKATVLQANPRTASCFSAGKSSSILFPVPFVRLTAQLKSVAHSCCLATLGDVRKPPPRQGDGDCTALSSVLLYDVSLTANEHVQKSSKQQIVRALQPYKETCKLLPASWRANAAPKRKRVSHPR